MTDGPRDQTRRHTTSVFTHTIATLAWRSFYLPLLGLLLLAACQSGAAPATAPSSTPAPVIPTVAAQVAAEPTPSRNTGINLDSFAPDRAIAHIRQLSVAIGSRPAGTDKERAAADYIADQLKSYGYAVEVQGFDFPWVEDLSALTLESGDKVEAAQIFRTKQAVVNGEIADAGTGANLQANSLPGKLALVERGGITFEAKAAEAARAGAVGIIIFNNQAGNFRGNMQNASAIPAIAISRESGLQLREQLRKGTVRAELAAQSKRSTIQSQNVVARAANTCSIVIGGHYDSVPEAPGANDNASGTAVMMEAARAAQPGAGTRKLCFVAFGAEELGLFGSHAYVQKLETAEKSAMAGMINLDMEGFGDTWRATGTDQLVKTSLEAAKVAGLQAERFDLPEGVGSDHESFQQAGIPVVYPAVLDDPLFHTPKDTIDRISADNLKQAGRWALAIILQMTK